ncbi:MAG TPA: hypothetical protein PLP16_07550 [Smithellaceae bacterium]|nr:hypothetical protein [Smithellaceae bacterium]
MEEKLSPVRKAGGDGEIYEYDVTNAEKVQRVANLYLRPLKKKIC